MVVEPVGLAVGLAGILLAFKGVVDTANLFDLVLSRDNGSKQLALKYFIERHKTIVWGDEFRPDDAAKSPLLREATATRRLIAGLLAEMRATHDLAEHYVSRYDMEKPMMIADFEGKIGIGSKLVKSVKEARDARGQKSAFTWAAKDKAKFTEIVQRMESLNSDLRELVQGSSTQSLAAALSASILPQIRDTMYLVALQQSDAADPLLKLSARLRQIQDNADTMTANKLVLHNLSKVFHGSDATLVKSRRPTGQFEAPNCLQKHAWIEWRQISNDLKEEDRELVESRIHALAAMLATAQAPEFHIPPFGGLVESSSFKPTQGRRIGYVFSVPESLTMVDSGPVSLLDLIGSLKECPPLLNERFELAYKLASAMSLMHASKWLHKSFRGDNILFFQDNGGTTYSILQPFVTGFEYSRPETQASILDRPTEDRNLDVYYHPDVIMHGFNRVRDFYSLGVVLLEIGMWESMASSIPASTGKTLDQLTLSNYRSLYTDSLPLLGSQMGASYSAAVRDCLTGDFPGTESDDGAALTRAFFTRVIQRLGHCRA